jgi:hypothetical protein
MSNNQEDQDSEAELGAMLERIYADSRAYFERQHPNGVEPPDPMPELADKVDRAIDEHANGHEDDAAGLFPGVRLDQGNPRHAELINRLQRGAGKSHEIKLVIDKDGSHWAVRDFDASLKSTEQEDREYDERHAAQDSGAPATLQHAYGPPRRHGHAQEPDSTPDTAYVAIELGAFELLADRLARGHALRALIARRRAAR